MKLSAIDLLAIRAGALLAGGETAFWEAEDCRIEDQNGNVVVYDEGRPTPTQATHISNMDPATTLALLDLIDELQTRIG